MIWSKTYNWVIKKHGTHTTFLVWLDFLTLFSSLKLKNLSESDENRKHKIGVFRSWNLSFNGIMVNIVTLRDPRSDTQDHTCAQTSFSSSLFLSTVLIFLLSLSSFLFSFFLFFFKLGSFNCFSFSYLFFSSSRLGSFIFFSFFSFSFFHFGFFSSFSSRNDGRGLRFQLWFAF